MTEPSKNFKYSSKLFFIFPLVTFIFFTSVGLWRNKASIAHDVNFYYEYLPAIFIDFDLTFPFRNDQVWLVNTPIGGQVPKMSMGMAILYAPYFLIVHLFSWLVGWETEHGYANQYHYAVSASGAIHAMLGLWFLRKTLLKYFSELTVFFTLIAIYFGTNLFHYSYKDGGMTHEHTFMLTSLLIYFYPIWWEKPSLKMSAILGLISGLMVLVRPINIVFLLLLALYKCDSFTALKINFKKIFLDNFKFLLITGFFAFLVWLPQMLLWKYAAGSFFYYSYGDEGFFFSQPRILQVLFSYRNGLIPYFPVLIFAFVGIMFLKNKVRDWYYSILLFLPLFLYVVSCWWTWWYGGAFGSRVSIDMYAVLAIPLAAFFETVLEWANRLKYSMLIMMKLCIALALFHTFQFHRSIIHWHAMTPQAYWAIFLQTQTPPNFDSLLYAPDYERAIRGIDR